MSTGPEAPATDEPARLHQAELALARMQGEIGTNFRERVAALEKGQENFATKADLERAKVWGLTSLLAALMSILILVMRFVSWIWPSP